MATEIVNVEINGIKVQAEKGWNILQAAKKAGVTIPTLCYHPDLKPGASCGICVVRELQQDRKDPTKWKPSRKLVRACVAKVKDGMRVITHDPEIVETRRSVLELILANHANDCLQCSRCGR